MKKTNGTVVRRMGVAALFFVVFFPALWVFAGNSNAAETQGIEGLKISGDGRARYELDERTRLTGGQYQDQKRDRFRYRLRLGFTYAADERLELGGRVSSGDTTDANSPHVIDGSNNNDDGGTAGFSRDSISIDKAYLKYKYNNAQLENLTSFAWFGKEAMPMWTQNEYFWDADINPEGVAAGLTYKKIGPVSVTLQGGKFVIDEGSWSPGSTVTDRELRAYQGVVTAGFSPADITVSYGMVKTDAGVSVRSQNATNTNTARYRLASVQGKIKAIPDTGITIGYDYMNSNVNTFVNGKKDNKGSVVSLGASYKDFSASVLRPNMGTYAVTAFAQDNFPNYFSNFKGTEFKVGYKIAKNINVDINRFDGKRRTDEKQKESRTQFNLNVSF